MLPGMSRTLGQQIALSACSSPLPPLAPSQQLPHLIMIVRRGNLLRRPLGWADTSKVRQTGERIIVDQIHLYYNDQYLGDLSHDSECVMVGRVSHADCLDGILRQLANCHRSSESAKPP